MNKIAVLYDAGQAVLSTFDLDEVLQRILEIAHDYFHLRNVAILLLDQQSQQLCVRSQIGWDEGQDKIRWAPGEGITGAAANKKQPFYASSTTSIPRPSIYSRCSPRMPPLRCKTLASTRWSNNAPGNCRRSMRLPSKPPRFSTSNNCWIEFAG